MYRWPKFAVLLFALIAATGYASIVETERGFGNAERRWNGNRVRLAVSSSLSESFAIKPGSSVERALENSIRRWEAVADVTIELVESPLNSISPKGIRGDGTSLLTISAVPENISVFSGDLASAAAVTRLFFDRSGRIVEGDILLNPLHQFSTDRTFGTFDLESVFTHEIGHLLGLGHSMIGSSLMFEDRKENPLFSKATTRELSADDISKVRALYDPANPDPECCGSISGRISGGRPSIVWAQNVENGSVETADLMESDGRIWLKGLRNGTYEVFGQPVEGALSATSYGRVNLDLDEGKVTLKKTDLSVVFDMRFAGIDGQLSTVGLSLEAGGAYRIVVGGYGEPGDGSTLRSTSKLIRIDDRSVAHERFDNGIVAFSADVSVDPSTPTGEYSLFVADRVGNKRFLVGIISVVSTN